MLAMLSITIAYFCFIFATLEPIEMITVMSVVTVLCRVVNLFTIAFNPLLAGQVAYRLGPHALPVGLSLPKREVACMMVPIVAQFLGIVCVHVHLLVLYPWGAVPVALACCMAGLSFSCLFFLFYSWMKDFQHSAKMLASTEGCLTVNMAETILNRLSCESLQ
jgi:hypothetical protein